MKDLPALPYREWRDTLETLHRWSQVVGKVKLALTPLLNHWWNVPLSVSAHGLTTGSIPYGDRHFEIELDFVDDILRIRPDDGHVASSSCGLAAWRTSTRRRCARSREANIEVPIWTRRSEIADPIPFAQDEQHGSYDREYVMRFWRCISRIDPVFAKFRAGFIGKSSPVQFFWGSFDLTVASSRAGARRRSRAIDRAGGLLARAVQHRLVAGRSAARTPAFYAYAAPEPRGLRERSDRAAAGVLPAGAPRLRPRPRRGAPRRGPRGDAHGVLRHDLWRGGRARCLAARAARTLTIRGGPTCSVHISRGTTTAHPGRRAVRSA